MNETASTGAPRAVRVWDLPTRLFHGALALCVVAAVISAKIGGNAMVWHLRLGYAVLALLVFRLLWGFVGGRWSRFTHFFYSPAAFWRYLRGQALPGDRFDVGHSPLGALAALAMLSWLALQVGSGLIADDEIATVGPLVRLASGETSLSWTAFHKHWGQWGVLLLVGLHLAAIAFYTLVKRRALLPAMWHGDKPLSGEMPPSQDGAASRLLALLLMLGCGYGVYRLVLWGLGP